VDDSRLQWATLAAPPRKTRLPRLAGALGVERRALATVFGRAQHNLHRLRALTLPELLALGLRLGDAERIFYLVQWERLQAHLERRGELPESAELAPLLEALNPIFERHFRRGSRLNETLVALYRAELSGRDSDSCLTLAPPSPAKRFLTWLGFEKRDG